MIITNIYLAHIHAAITALSQAQRLDPQGRPLQGVLAAVLNLSIAAEEASKAARMLRLNPGFPHSDGE